MSPDLLIYLSLPVALLIGLFVGFYIGRTEVGILTRELHAMRTDLHQREVDLGKRAQREHKFVTSVLDNEGLAVSEGKNRVLDRSPKAVAEIIQRRKVEENRQQWQEVLEKE